MTSWVPLLPLVKDRVFTDMLILRKALSVSSSLPLLIFAGLGSIRNFWFVQLRLPVALCEADLSWWFLFAPKVLAFVCDS